MASGDFMFLADKPTLDIVKTNVDTANANINIIKTNTTALATASNLSALRTVTDAMSTNVNLINANTDTIETVLGTTTNTGGSTTAGTLMGKINYLLSLWTSAKSAFLDATVSSRQSETNALTRYNALNAEIAIVKTSVINGKTNLATAINNIAGTGLNYLTSFADMVWHINNSIKRYNPEVVGLKMIEFASTNENINATKLMINDGAWFPSGSGNVTTPTQVGQMLIAIGYGYQTTGAPGVSNATFISSRSNGDYSFVLYKATSTSCSTYLNSGTGQYQELSKLPTTLQ